MAAARKCDRFDCGSRPHKLWTLTDRAGEKSTFLDFFDFNGSLMVVDSNVGAEINVVLLIFSLYRNIQKISGSRRSLIVPFRARFNRDLFISQATSTATSFHSFFSGNFGIMTSYLNSTYRVCVSTKIGKD